MKSVILKVVIFMFLVTLFNAGCSKNDEDFSYLDSAKKFDSGIPGFAIYKTKKDYFYNVSIKPIGDIINTPELNEESGSIKLFKNKYYYTGRYRLIDGYIASEVISYGDVFTSLTYDEYIREHLSPGYNDYNPNPKVLSSIIDRDPFTEYYSSNGPFDGKAEISIAEINQLIKENNLEKYFQKIK